MGRRLIGQGREGGRYTDGTINRKSPFLQGTATSRTKDDASATTLLGDVVEDERSSGFWSDATIDAETGNFQDSHYLQREEKECVILEKRLLGIEG